MEDRIHHPSTDLGSNVYVAMHTPEAILWGYWMAQRSLGKGCGVDILEYSSKGFEADLILDRFDMVSELQ